MSGGKDWRLEEGKAALNKEVRWYVGRCFRVEGRTDTSFSLSLPEKFSFLCALVWLLVFGIGIVVYLIYYASKRVETRYLEVLEDGTVLKDGEPIPPPFEVSSWRQLWTGSDLQPGLNPKGRR